MDPVSIVLATGVTAVSLQVISQKVADIAFKQIGHNFGVAEKLQDLKRELLKVQNLIEKVESKHSISNTCQTFIEEFKNLLLDAEDVLDKIDLEWQDNDPWTLEFRSKREVSRMLLKVDGLSKKMESTFTLEINKPTPPQFFAIHPHHSSSFVDVSSVIGRATEKKKIIEILLPLQGEEVEGVHVIPIVGMGGIGKTTLVQLVYNDADVIKKFDLKMWVCVCSENDLAKITESIFESATKEPSGLSGLDAIQTKLQNVLMGKKVLLVLDAMWDENPNTWDALKLPFSSAAKGSRIVVTTRSKIVSSIVTTSPAYVLDDLQPLKPLPHDEDCWTIIKQSLSHLDGREDLVQIGKEIAKKCKGLPLVARVIGSVLRFKSKETSVWDELLKCELWDLPKDKNQIYPILKLSYDHLPAYLKMCFAYCSIFPHSHPFQKDDLIELWAAQGFIQAEGTRRIEDIGREYFDGLCSRSLFRVSSSNVAKYEMDFIHDLARLVSTNLCFSLKDGMSCFLPVSPDVRHSSLLDQNIQQSTLEEFHRYKKLRTFMLLSKSNPNLNNVPQSFFQNLPCLRVLNLSYSDIFELSDSIGQLIHLRHLDLSHTRIRILPESIAKLSGLETLKLKNCESLFKLPTNLKKLIKLRHFVFDSERVKSLPLEVGRLTSLKTLTAFIVQQGCRIVELKNMRCLQSICIQNLENVANRVEAKSALLENKQYLDKLELQWNRTINETVAEEIFMGLKPHDRLNELQVKGYCGSKFPDWIGDASFCKLSRISLVNCNVCTLLPSLGQLPALKHLVIEEMRNLERMDDQFCALAAGTFPSLETLKFEFMPRLKTWSGINENVMPNLRDLVIESCPKLVALPSVHHLTSLEMLSIDRCRSLQSIPDGGLPRSLKHFIILDSDILKGRYTVRTGEDWDNINWIPNVSIDDLAIRRDGHDC